jgi:short-subunit dehydrogenase
VTALVEDGSAQGESPRDENKMMMPEEVANKLYRAIKGRRRFIVLTTVGKLTNLFVKFYPAWVEREYYKHFTREPDSPLEP